MRNSFSSENSISFCEDNYESKEKLFSDVAKISEILTRNGYQMSFRYEDAGVYTLEFNYDDIEYGTPRIYWLDSEQVDCLFSEQFIEED